MTAIEIAQKILNREIVLQVNYSDLFREFCEELTDEGYCYYDGDLYKEVMNSYDDGWDFLCAASSDYGKFSSVKHGSDAYGKETTLEELNYISIIKHVDISLEEFL